MSNSDSTVFLTASTALSKRERRDAPRSISRPSLTERCPLWRRFNRWRQANAFSCFLAIPSSGLESIAAKTRDAGPFSMTILGQDSGAGVLQTAAAIGFEPKFIESDNDHDALNETNAMTPRIFIDIPRCS